MIPVDLAEIERKRALGEREPLEGRLREAGFTPTGPVVEVDTYYSRPDVDFLETVECLRVRESAGRCEVTYKPASGSGTHGAGGVVAKQETNVALADEGEAAHAHRLLEALGMVLLARVEKSRTCYRDPGRPDLSVVVDAVAGVGSFVETEIVSSDERQDVVRRLEEAERLLGLEALPVVTLPYRNLVLAAAVSRGAAEQGSPVDGAVRGCVVHR